ncbi:hypothetical protein TYRP_020740 [Tyrophagus putrescentiae]|nr:hypothetical protein TYRP_020740 [Tyrophagus putrescentiae]
MLGYLADNDAEDCCWEKWWAGDDTEEVAAELGAVEEEEEGVVVLFQIFHPAICFAILKPIVSKRAYP